MPRPGEPGVGGGPDRSASPPPQSQPFLSSVRTLFAPRPHNQILADLAPQLLQSRILGRGGSHFSARDTASSFGATSNSILRGRLGWTGQPTDSTAVYILERVDELLQMDVPPAPFELSPPPATNPQGWNARQSLEFPAPDAQVPLIRGFAATTPAAQIARAERRRRRAGVGEAALGLDGSKLGLKARGDRARGLLADGQEEASELGINRRTTGSGSSKRRKAPKGASEFGVAVSDELEMSPEELAKDGEAVQQDMGNVAVKRALLNSQISEVDSKMAALDAIREGLRRSLLSLREEELELEDELSGIQEQLTIQEERKKGRTVSLSSRRRKGPAFLPEEHEDLPTGVAFMTLVGHLAPITSLDFTEPYGVAVTASLDESVRFWDLTTGDEMGFLRGHTGVVKALQVESSVCVTGGADGQIRIWDLDLAEAERAVPLATPSGVDGLTNSMDALNVGEGGAGLVNGNDEGMMREDRPAPVEAGPCVRTLDGHTKAVTSLYFDESCLVTGSSDRTLRQWDLQTGQCVLTMDILWAISNPQASQRLSSEPDEVYEDPYSAYASPTSSPRKPSLASPLRRQSSTFGSAPATTTYADGSWEMYEDFVGGVQFWGYALASGTGDGCVRMWDMRTGQAHRTLVGHTAPVTCVQFDELHLVSGSLDKSIRIWDLRTGAISDTIRYDHPITGLQFDSRKIVAAAGENGVRTFNRTTLEHSTLSINGHTSPVERLRFMDRYLATGGRDCTVKLRGVAFAARVNTFKTKPPSITCYHYDVSPAFRRCAILAQTTKLPAPSGEWDVALPESDGRPSRGGNHFHVKITLIRPIDLSVLSVFIGKQGSKLDPADVLSAVQALNVAIQHGPMLSYPSKGASFFLPPSDPQAVSLSKGLEMWKGYYTSLRAGPGTLFVNVDVTSCPMIASGSLSTLMTRFAAANTRGGGGAQTRLIHIGNRFLKGLRVSMTVPDSSTGLKPHRKILEYLPRKNVGSVEFDVEGTRTTMVDYFQRNYAVRLQHLDWSQVDVNAGQKFNKKLDPSQTAESLKLTTVGLTQWGLNIEPQLMQINYQKEVVPRDGVWDRRGQPFVKPAVLNGWIVLVFEDPKLFHLLAVQNAVVALVKECRAAGIQISNPEPHIEYAPRSLQLSAIADFIRTTAKKPETKLQADVTHPAPGSISPSIAGVIGSMNPQLSEYGNAISIQQSRVEVIQDLAGMVEKLLRQYGAKNGPPKRVVMLRDGVSEGQFETVLAHEVNAIRRACQNIKADFKPLITYIVCGKRHHISFFPDQPKDADRNGNVKAGTTCDTGITSPFQFDWYCQSHASLLGTGRSAHYTVLVDESRLTADQLQAIHANHAGKLFWM
ncbi:hypothetical protein RQP46_000375 [Phenoliferia psychrophenolica]